MLAESEEDDGYGASGDEEAIMDIPDSTDEEAYSEEDVLYNQEAAGAEDEEKWGRSKRAFYSADKGAEEEEAVEAKKLQKKRLQAMRPEDFTDSRAVRRAKASGPITLDVSEDESVGSAAESEAESEAEFELDDEQVATLSADEKIALLSRHSDEFGALVADFTDRLGYLETEMQPLMAKLAALPTSEGLSFLKVKYQLLTAYCTNVAFYIQLKLAGKRLQDHPVLGKLVRFRLLLEKIKPMETKLRPQVDRLLKAAAGQADAPEAETARHRPNPDMFVKDGGLSSEEEGSGAVYRAPKLQPMHYPEDESAVARKQKHEDYLKKVNASSRLIQDIRAEYEDAPEEEALDVVYGSKTGRPGRREQAARDEYEEENFVRFTLDRKTKRKLKETAAKPIDELADLNDFIDEISSTRKPKSNKRAKGEAAVVEAPTGKRQKHADIEDESDIEDDYYGKVKAEKQARKQQAGKPHASKGPVKYRPVQDMRGDKARPANYAMMKNKGLTQHRPKDAKNPRVRQRAKYERAEKRLGSFRAVNKGQTGKYGGEDSGIRTNVVRSTKF